MSKGEGGNWGTVRIPFGKIGGITTTPYLVVVKSAGTEPPLKCPYLIQV